MCVCVCVCVCVCFTIQFSVLRRIDNFHINSFACRHSTKHADLSGCLTVQIHSLLHCSSLVLAKASLTEGALLETEHKASLTHGALLDSANARATEHAVKDDICGGKEVTVVFSQRCARFLQLDQCASIRIHPPW